MMPWMEYETGVIEAHYPSGGWPACIGLLTVERSPHAIMRKACSMGIARELDIAVSDTGKGRLAYYTPAQEAAWKLMRKWRYSVEPATLRWAA